MLEEALRRDSLFDGDKCCGEGEFEDDDGIVSETRSEGSGV